MNNGRRTLARLGALALGTVGLVAIAAPAQAATTCSAASGHLTITVSDGTAPLVTVSTAKDSAQADAWVVRVANPSPVTCVDGSENAFRLDDLVDITLKNLYGGNLRLDVSKPFERTNGTLVPVIVQQYTVPGTQMGLDVLAATPSAQVWSAVPGSIPALDLDSDSVADVSIDTGGGNHTDRISLITGSGNDTIDLQQDTLPAGWPVYTYVDTGEGADNVHGGPEQDWVWPGYGPDQVHVSTYDQVTVFGDFDTDLLMSDSLQGTDLIYTDFNNIQLHPDDLLANDGTDFDLESGTGDNVAGFRTYTTGTGNDVFVEPAGETAIGFDGGAGYDTFDASGLLFSIYVNSFQSNDKVDISFPNQTIAPLLGVNYLVGTPWSDGITVVDDNVTIAPGQGDDQVQSRGARTMLLAEAVADGADTFDTQTGDGMWNYGARTGPVSVTLDQEYDDGAPGEHDLVTGDDVSTVVTGSGNDTVVGDFHATGFETGGGNDTVLARGGNDTLGGLDGDDLLVGGGGDDRLDGGPGNDRLNGSAGDDDEYGFTGNDTFQQGSSVGDNGSDLMVGSDGTDTVTYLGRSGGVTLSNNGVWDDGLAGEYDRVGAGIEKLLGTNSADVISGGVLADWLHGYGGSDTLHGNAGNDTIDGGTAADKLYGDAGNDSIYAKDGTKDTVSGGTGTDRARRDTIDALLSIEGSL